MNPQDVIKQRVAELADVDPSVRRLAADALAEADERALYPLIKALRDENTGVQDAAMRSIIAIGGETAAYMTLPLLREEALLRNTSRIILKQIGESAVPLLQRLLLDKDDDIRIFAVDLIAEIRHCKFPQDIARLLESDPNPNVRASAARAVARLGYDKALPRLHSALSDEEWVVISALEALAEFRDESSTDRIAALLSSPSETVRYAAVEALGRLGSRRGSAALLARLGTATDFEKTALVRSLVQIGVTPSMTEVYDLLIALLGSEDWDDKLIALRGLASLRDPRAIRPIADAAGSLDPSEPESDERLAEIGGILSAFGCGGAMTSLLGDGDLRFRAKVLIIESLGGLRCAEAVPGLIALLDGNLREVRRASARALAEIGGDASIETLRESIDDRDGHVRRAAAAALGRIADRASFEPLLRALTAERYPDVFAEMVKSLLLIDAPELYRRMAALPVAAREIIGRAATDEAALLELSRDPAGSVKLAALAGLANAGTPAAVDRLVSALVDDDAEARKAALASLGTLGRGREAVLPLLRDRDLWVRLAALNALARMADPRDIDVVIGMTGDPEPFVACAAIDALARAGGEAAQSALGRLRSDPRPDVRERAVRALEGMA